jgi:hypothetical protein
MLNPKLHGRLERAVGHVRVVNEGVAMSVAYRPDWTPTGVRLKAHYADRGETYYVNCPVCNDSKRRLAVNHRWAERDARARDDNLHLAKCFNEDCLSNREAQKQLHAIVYPAGQYAGEVEVPVKPIRTSPAEARVITLPPSTPLDRLPGGHPARRYLRGRGFSPTRLARDYDVAYADGCTDSSPPLYGPRIVVPVYEPVFDAVAAGIVVSDYRGVPRTLDVNTRTTGTGAASGTHRAGRSEVRARRRDDYRRGRPATSSSS